MKIKKRESINIDDDINQAIKEAIDWNIEKDSGNLIDLIQKRTKLNYSREMIALKLKEYKMNLNEKG